MDDDTEYFHGYLVIDGVIDDGDCLVDRGDIIRGWPTCIGLPPDPPDDQNPEKLRSRIAGALKARRKLRGWTQKELGEKLGLSRASISAYECGLRQPSDTEARTVTLLLGGRDEIDALLRSIKDLESRA